jgi:histidyl-tRNA synthetase
MSVEDAVSGPRAAGLDVYVAPLGDEAYRRAATLASELRRRGVSVETGFDVKLKRALELANKLCARYTLILGDED